MATLFTMNADVKTFDVTGTSGSNGVEVHFDMNICRGDMLILTEPPRATLIEYVRITGYIRSDGRMYDTPAVSAVPFDLADPGNIGVRLLANDPDFNLSTPISYRVTFGSVRNGKLTVYRSWDTPAVPTMDTTVDLAAYAPGPGLTVTGVNIVHVDELYDAGNAGKEVVKSSTTADVVTALGGASAVRSAIGAGTSSLALGTTSTTAKRGDYAPAWSEVTGKPTVIAAGADAATARTAIGATSPDDVNALISSSPTLASAAASAVDTQLASSTNPRLLRPIVTGSVVWAVTDEEDRTAIQVDITGKTLINSLDMASIPGSSVTADKLTSDVQAGLQIPIATGDVVAAVVDSQDRMAFGVTKTGALLGAFPTPQPTDLAVWEITGTSPNRKLWTLDHASGTRTLVTASGDPRSPTLVNGAIRFTVDAGESVYVNGSVIPAYPARTTIACWGDSLTEIGGWSEQLDTLLPASVVNLGTSGQTAEEIALRQGGYTLTLTVSGGTIPASGAVSVSSSQSYLRNTGIAWTQIGTLAGVPGTLNRAIGAGWDAMTFTRTSSGSAVTVASPVVFASDAATTYESNPAIILAGRNDLNVATISTDVRGRVLATHNAMVARLKAFHSEYLILGTVSNTDGIDTSNGAGFAAINATLQNRFGNRFLDLQTYMSQQCIYDLGITPTTADLTAMSKKAVPPSLMNPSVVGHFSAAAGAAAATNLIKPKLDALGWTL